MYKRRRTSSAGSKSALIQAIEEDEKTIKKFEKKLGFNKRKGASARCFRDLGLGDVWDIIEKIDGVSCNNLDKKSGKDCRNYKQSHKERQSDQADEDDGDNIEENNEGQNETMYDPDSRVSTSLSDDDEDIDDGDDDDDDDDDDEEQEEKGEEDNEGLSEDIYGRLRDKNGRIVKVKPTKRQFSAVYEEEDINEETCKRIRGLLNRLTSANLMAISGQIASLLKETSLHQINHCLSKCIENLIVRDVALSPQRLISENAMLVAVLNCNIGDEIGGHMIHYFVKKFDLLSNELQDNSPTNLDSKKLDNTVAFLCYLTACNLMDVSLMFEIIQKIYQTFTSKSVQLILLTLKVIGFVLRRGDPGKMRQMILDIQKASTHYESTDKRINFMLEALNAVKNNNLNKLNTISEDTTLSQVDVQALRSALKNGIKNNTSVSCLPGRYDQVLKSSRWWIKTDNYVEDERKEELKKKRDKKEKSVTLDAKSEKLCSKLQLVTPLRKNVFKALISCEDYVECCSRLVQIGGRQFIEVVNVCMLLALKEKQFNYFYVYLLDKLACYDRKYKLAVMCTLRDRINDLNRFSPVELTNLCKLIAELVKKNAIPITVLKSVQFSDLDPIYMQFLKDILGPILALDDNQLIKILSKIKPKDPFAKALKLFISCFLNSDCDIVAVWPKTS